LKFAAKPVVLSVSLVGVSVAFVQNEVGHFAEI
jgi:hypothetical protein